jgi:hypothetical protein
MDSSAVKQKKQNRKFYYSFAAVPANGLGLGLKFNPTNILLSQLHG